MDKLVEQPADMGAPNPEADTSHVTNSSRIS
jgi:hypothetical protein